MRILLVYNGRNPAAKACMQQAAADWTASGGELAGPARGYSIDELRALGCSAVPDCDAVLLFGGDGTILAAERILAPLELPLCGVNFGRVGFLSSMETDELTNGLRRLLAGEYTITDRMMLRGQVFRQGVQIADHTAFNEFVVRSGELSRAVSFSLEVDGQPVNDYLADGIIVATPTGSTGYSLSAGGPIVLSDIEMLLITPVCAQSFFARPVVAAASSQATIVCTGDRDRLSLTVDGQSSMSLRPQDRVCIGVSPWKARIIQFQQENYFERIKRKLYRRI